MDKISFMGKDGWDLLKIVLGILVLIAVIFVVILLVEKFILFILRKINDLKKYNEQKLIKKITKEKRGFDSRQRDKQTTERYYPHKIWKWQENKTSQINRAFSTYDRVKKKRVETHKIPKKNNSNKIKRYRREVRIYFED